MHRCRPFAAFAASLEGATEIKAHHLAEAIRHGPRMGNYFRNDLQVILSKDAVRIVKREAMGAHLRISLAELDSGCAKPWVSCQWTLEVGHALAVVPASWMGAWPMGSTVVGTADQRMGVLGGAGRDQE